MSADAAAAAAPPADSQDDLKKPNDMSTEDESSLDSKTEVKETKDNGEATSVKENIEDKKEEGNAAADAKVDEVKPEKDDVEDKAEKKGENGETHEEDEAEEKPKDVKKSKKDETEEDEEEEEEEEEEEAEVKPKAKKPAPKKKPKNEDGDDEEEEDDAEEEEEEEEEEEQEPAPKKPKKEPTEPPVPVPAGKGIPLGHIPNVEIAISRFKIEDLKVMHQFLYNQICRTNLIKRNIKKFKGYEFDKDSAEYETKVEETKKLEPKQLRMLCEMLDLDKRGKRNLCGPADLASRIVGFLVLPKNSSPHSRGAVKERVSDHGATPGGRPRRSAAVKVHNRGYSDEEYETDPETKVRGPKVARDDSADSDGSYNPSGSGQDPDSDFDPAAGEVAGPGRKRKAPTRRSSKPGKRRGRPKKGSKPTTAKRGRGRRPAQSESEEESESESGSEQGSDSENQDSDPLMQEPPAKRGRGAVSGRGRKPGVKNNKSPVVVKKKAAPASPAKKKPGPASAAKAKPAAKAGKKRKQSSSEDDSEGSEEEGSEEEEEGSSEGSEEDQPLTNQAGAKKGKHPPTDEEIKKCVKQILDGANLEEITMKTVCKQVYSHYPDFDLAHKKDFIKATVKSLISS